MTEIGKMLEKHGTHVHMSSLTAGAKIDDLRSGFFPICGDDDGLAAFAVEVLGWERDNQFVVTVLPAAGTGAYRRIIVA